MYDGSESRQTVLGSPLRIIMVARSLAFNGYQELLPELNATVHVR